MASRPDLNGSEFARRLCGHDGLEHLPSVPLSGEGHWSTTRVLRKLFGLDGLRYLPTGRFSYWRGGVEPVYEVSL